MQVRAQQGDTLDSLCWRHLGSTDPVESAIELNPGLAALGAEMPNGRLVTLPDAVAQTAKTNLLQLWD
ncbi:tail protein X [Dechloromonas denitrificans]|uniref:tail protein X n=1 Tax=Dechloromonas denitrificans TaxID=281362 RepID=UPI001CF85B88|nr:tail protein X [Dechloromonas denitrificans]UCV02294.1 tail protein X [Dechloromonas denitrificans]